MVKGKSCCVKGCKQTTEDDETEFHKFPQNKVIKKKWLSTFKTSRKVTLNSLVCGEHFTEKDYKTVRGKQRLKITAVPSVFDESQLKGKEEDDGEDDVPLKAAEVPFIDVRMTEVIAKEPYVMDGTPMDFEETIPEAKITKNFIEKSSSSPSGDDKYFETEINKETSPKPTQDTTQLNGDALNSEIQEKDTQKDTTTENVNESKPEETSQNISQDVSQDKSQDISQDISQDEDRLEYVPDFIEIAVQNSKGDTTGEPDDCMMVLENVQVDIDPALLLQNEEEPTETVDLVTADDDKPAEPVSLLTSSDESDVIIEEPHIDTVEVSDETDEDDKPLTKLCPGAMKRKKIKKILWGKLGELYCYSCSYVTDNKAKLEEHSATHIQDRNKEIFSCSSCIFTTSSKYQFARHKKSHKADRVYKCNQCNYKARHEMSLLCHMKIHEDSITCNVCDYKTQDVKAMHSHMKKHKQVRFKNGKKKYLRRKRKKEVSKSDSSEEEYVPPM